MAVCLCLFIYVAEAINTFKFLLISLFNEKIYISLVMVFF